MLTADLIFNVGRVVVGRTCQLGNAGLHWGVVQQCTETTSDSGQTARDFPEAWLKGWAAVQPRWLRGLPEPHSAALDSAVQLRATWQLLLESQLAPFARQNRELDGLRLGVAGADVARARGPRCEEVNVLWLLVCSKACTALSGR
jgi:hypothetical protein